MENSVQLAKLQEDLRHQVVQEYETQRQTLARTWAMPVEQRVEEGRCVVGGSLSEKRGTNKIVIGFPANDSRFRDGDFVRISQGDPNTPLCDAVVIRAEDEFIELDLWKSVSESLPLQSAAGKLQIDESALDLEHLFQSAIEDLGKTEVGREVILPLIAGETKSKLDLSTFEEKLQQARTGGFDEEQSKAIASALAADVCWLIHGPPGTGKTRVLASIVRSLVERGERVLITSANHRAINHLLQTIAEINGDRRGIFKITPFQDPAFPLPQFPYFLNIPSDQVGGAFVIGATPFALRTRRLSKVDFDTVIIDEASQVSTMLAVMAMLAGKRYILAGDHHQLPPVMISQDARAGGSIFGRLVGRGMDTMLTTTHRLNKPLCEWPSVEFYQSRLEPSGAAAGRRLMLADIDPEFSRALSPEPALIWLAVHHTGSRTHSPEEVEAVARLLLALQRGGLRWEEVGVVVPFRRQARFLRQRLRKQLTSMSGGSALIADTVERMQGQEREVIVLTLTASDPFFLGKTSEFLLQPERLNVAVTRARTKTILVASPVLVEMARKLPEEIAGPFLSLIAMAERVDDTAA